jgi:hypothetical protein
MTRWQTRGGVVGLILVGAVLAFASGVLVTIVRAQGGVPSQLRTCVDERGAVRIVGASDNCHPNETALDWPPSGGGITIGPGGITIGGGIRGGVTGRWEGTVVKPSAPSPCASGTWPFLAVFVEDTFGNISGSIKAQLDFVRPLLAPTSTMGQVIRSRIEFDVVPFGLILSGTVRDEDSMEGVTMNSSSNTQNCPQGTWSARRVQ